MQTTLMLKSEVWLKGSELLMLTACGPSPVLFRWLTGSARVNTTRKQEGDCSLTQMLTLFTQQSLVDLQNTAGVSWFLKGKILLSPNTSAWRCWRLDMGQHTKYWVSVNPDLSLTAVEKSILKFLAKGIWSPWCIYTHGSSYHKAAQLMFPINLQNV